MWFAASLFYQSNHSKPHSDGLWEERIVLLSAEDEVSAAKQAEAIGKSQETGFAVAPDDQVTWRFVCVERIQSIDAEVIQSGLEVFSRFLRASGAKSLLRPFE